MSFQNPFLKNVKQFNAPSLSSSAQNIMNDFIKKTGSNVLPVSENRSGIDRETQQENMPGIVIMSKGKKVPAKKSNTIIYIVAAIVAAFLIYQILKK